MLIIPLLVTVLASAYASPCPTECQCSDKEDYLYCLLHNKTVLLEMLPDQNYPTNKRLSINCEDSSNTIVCSEFPRLDGRVHTLAVIHCPPRVMRCVHGILHEPVILIVLARVSEIIKSEDVADFKYVEIINLHLPADAMVPITTINAWPSLIAVIIFGGQLQSSNSFNHTMLENLRMFHTKVRAIPDGDFDGLSGLKDLVISDGGIEEIRAGSFRGLGSLTKLDIIESRLQFIHPDALAGVPKLENLTLDGITLKTLSNFDLLQRTPIIKYVHVTCAPAVDQTHWNVGSHVFSKNHRLHLIELRTCRLSNLTESLFANSSVASLNISDNIIYNISSKLFLNLPKLTHLDLSNNSLHELPEGIFDNLTSLRDLRLSYNRLQNLQKKIFNDLTALENLDLSNNDIRKLPDEITVSLSSLKSLNLGNNGILDLQANIVYNLISLETLVLTKNKINYFYHEVPMKALIVLDLSYNEFTVISGDFSIGTKLTKINLSNNKIVSIVPTSGHDDKVENPFANLPSLRKLDLSGNRLHQLYDGWETDLQHTRELNLANNSFTNFKIFQAIDYSKWNITIDLRHNYISDIVLDTRVCDSNDIYSLPSSSLLLLDGNPINCDCNSYGLLQRLRGLKLYTEPEYILPNAICNSPQNLKGSLIRDVSPTDLICDLHRHLPKNCISFMATFGELILECLTMPSLLPELNPHYLPYSYYKQPLLTLNLREQPQSLDQLHINKLILSNISINNVKFKPIDSLKSLDLTFNNLVTIPDQILDANITLYLSGNPLNCDCQLLSKLNKSNSLADAALVFCVNEGKNFTEIDISELCTRTTILTSYFGIGIVCGSFLMMIVVAVCKHVKRNWTSIINSFRTQTPERPIALETMATVQPFKYDLFLSFAREDEEFIREKLLPKLEYKFRLNVCVYYRDWEIQELDLVPNPELIVEQIVKSVKNSRKTVIFLTEDYVLSEWLNITFSSAYNLSMQERSPTVVIILQNEDIIQDERLSDDLKTYIQENSYLQFEDPDFWQTCLNTLTDIEQK